MCDFEINKKIMNVLFILLFASLSSSSLYNIQSNDDFFLSPGILFRKVDNSMVTFIKNKPYTIRYDITEHILGDLRSLLMYLNELPNDATFNPYKSKMSTLNHLIKNSLFKDFLDIYVNDTKAEYIYKVEYHERSWGTAQILIPNELQKCQSNNNGCIQNIINQTLNAIRLKINRFKTAVLFMLTSGELSFDIISSKFVHNLLMNKTDIFHYRLCRVTEIQRNGDVIFITVNVPYEIEDESYYTLYHMISVPMVIDGNTVTDFSHRNNKFFAISFDRNRYTYTEFDQYHLLKYCNRKTSPFLCKSKTWSISDIYKCLINSSLYCDSEQLSFADNTTAAYETYHTYHNCKKDEFDSVFVPLPKGLWFYSVCDPFKGLVNQMCTGKNETNLSLQRGFGVFSFDFNCSGQIFNKPYKFEKNMHYNGTLTIRPLTNTIIIPKCVSNNESSGNESEVSVLRKQVMEMAEKLDEIEKKQEENNKKQLPLLTIIIISLELICFIFLMIIIVIMRRKNNKKNDNDTKINNDNNQPFPFYSLPNFHPISPSPVPSSPIRREEEEEEEHIYENDHYLHMRSSFNSN